MRAAWLVVLGMLSVAQAMAEVRTAPGPGCLDARRMAEMRQSAPGTLAVLDQDGRRFRIDLGMDCPQADEPGAQLLARDGWVCGGLQEYVRAGDVLCPVAAVTPIDARAYAALARAAVLAQDDVETMETVQVHEARRRGFGGSYSYCFSPRYLRAWSEDPTGLLVELSPQHSGGNRFYRVELAGNCPELDSSPAIVFRSGMGIGLICGNPGDQIVAVDDRGPGGPSLSPASRFRCTISAVYPHQSDGQAKAAAN